MERMSSVPNLPIKWSISIGTMINRDGDGDGHGDSDSDSTCKQAFSALYAKITSVNVIIFTEYS